MSLNPRTENTLMSDYKNRDSIVVRLAGDSGDGVQLMGSQFIASSALSGEDLANRCRRTMAPDKSHRDHRAESGMQLGPQ
jgi:hypothetical protein